MRSYLSLRSLLGLMLVVMTVSFVAVSDSKADDCPGCPVDPPLPSLDATCPTFVDNDPLLATNERAEATTAFGKIADAFSVSSKGEAAYNLDLEVPPGRAGVEPHVSLSYDSTSGAGLVGMGFSLGGFSSITRCPSNVAQDGRIRGVLYDTADNLCLDGFRLVKVNHIEHAGNGPYDEYRTFPDTFRSVRAYYPVGWNAANGPSWFEVYEKSGRILEYGRDAYTLPNGRVMGKNGAVRAWWITQEKDRRSNAIQFLYRNETDAVDGHTVTHVPQRINYTAHLASPVKAPTNAVVFDSSDVDVYLNAYVGGMEISRRPRLDKIRMVGANDAPVRSYSLLWDSNSLPGRSRISQIVECAQDNPSKCRPPTRLDWLDQPGAGFNWGVDTGIEYRAGDDVDFRFKWMMTDVTGDGLADLVSTRATPNLAQVIQWRVARNLGGVLSTPTPWASTNTPTLPSPELHIWGLTSAEVTFDIVPHDYDQDGITDLLFSDPTGSEIRWLRSPTQGAGFTNSGTGIFVPERSAHSAYIAPSAVLYADVDGDGVLDLIECHESPDDSGALIHGSWQLRRWLPGGALIPAGFGPPQNIDWLNGRSCYLKRSIHLVDTDGDGKTEILFPPSGYTRDEASRQGSITPQCVGPCIYQSLQWYQPSGAAAPEWSLTATGLLAPDWSAGAGRVLFLDVNGDGLTDVVRAGNEFFPGQLLTSINTGDGFLPPTPSLVGYSTDQAEYLDLSAKLDYDGDGRMDLLLPMRATACLGVFGKERCWVVLKSSAYVPGHFEFVPVDIPFSDEIDELFYDGFSQQLIPRVTDINGDGRDDVVMPIDGTFRLFVNEGPRDLLHTVTDGMNPLDPGDAGFLPNVSIEYGALLDHAKTQEIDPASPAAENETYLPRTDPDNDCVYPRTCAVGSKRVVSSYTVNNGQNQARRFTVHYRDGRSHRLGRGFLGFGTVLTIEDNLHAGRAEVYDNVTFYPTFQVFPHASSVVRAWGWVPELSQQYTKVAFTYTDRTMVTRNSGSSHTYFTVPIAVRTRKSEDVYLPMGGAPTLLDFVAVHAANPAGELLDTEEDFSNYDDSGTFSNATRTTVDVDDIRTVSRHVDNDEASWLIGKVAEETTCSESLEETKCRSTNRSYNGRGEVETEQRGDPGDLETGRKIEYTRDDYGNLILVVAEDDLGNHRSACVTYESEGIFPYAFSRLFGQVSRVAFDAGLGVPTVLKDPNGLETIWQHDAFGRTTREKAPNGVVTELGVLRLKNGGPQQLWWALFPSTKIAGVHRAGSELDSLGRTVGSWVRGPGVEAVSGPVQTVNPIYREDIAYDFYGRVAKRSNPWLIGDPHLYTEYQYDNLGRVLAVKSPWGYETTYEYSGNDVVATMPAAGTMLETSSRTMVDPLGRTIEVVDGNGSATTTTYGPFGAPRAVESPGGLFVTLRDAYGRVRTEVDPDRGTTTIDYNGFDEQTRTFDAAQREVVYAYDGIGRRIARVDDGVVTSRWHYDDPAKGYGRLADVQSLGGVTKSYTYDPKGRVSSVALLLGGETFTSVYQYDASSNVSKIEYPQGSGGAPFRIRNEYDVYDNLVGVRDDVDANHPYYWRLNRVNGAGQTSREVFGNIEPDQPNALFTERDYFADKGALKAIRTMAGATKVQDLAYTYDARLNLTSRIDKLQTGGNGNANSPVGEYFTYDVLDRLTSSSFDLVCGPGGSCGGQSLTYAVNGNIATKSDVAGGAAYTYDIPNAHPHAVAQIGSLSYGYDAVGNQTSRPELSIEYTPFDLPRKYTRISNGVPSGIPTTFEYDGDQTRVRKTTPTEETTYAGDYERVTHFGVPAAPTEHRYSIRSGERVVAVVTRTSQDTKTAYLHVDHLGSTDVITDGTGSALGTVLERRSYDAFGAKRNPVWGSTGPGAWAAKTTVGFTGHEGEEDFGLVNMKGRIYDPRVGRFLSTDPLVSHPKFSQSWNPYSYVLNNPLNLVDPSGFQDSSTYPPPPTDPIIYVDEVIIHGDRPAGTTEEGTRIAREIEHLSPTPEQPAAWQGDADMPLGGSTDTGGSLKENGIVQIEGGFVSGIALGIVPGAGFAAELATPGVLDKGTRSARIGRSVGQIFGGAASAVLGGTLEVGGGALSAGGISAFLGVPVMVVAVPLVTSGVANVGMGGRGLAQALMSSGSGTPVKDFSTPATKNSSGKYASEREARAMARTKLGRNPVQVEPGKLRSQDGRWQYRGKAIDLEGHGPMDTPHIHLEQLNPETGEVLYNLHLRW